MLTYFLADFELQPKCWSNYLNTIRGRFYIATKMLVKIFEPNLRKNFIIAVAGLPFKLLLFVLLLLRHLKVFKFAYQVYLLFCISQNIALSLKNINIYPLFLTKNIAFCKKMNFKMFNEHCSSLWRKPLLWIFAQFSVNFWLEIRNHQLFSQSPSTTCLNPFLDLSFACFDKLNCNFYLFSEIDVVNLFVVVVAMLLLMLSFQCLFFCACIALHLHCLFYVLLHISHVCT